MTPKVKRATHGSEGSSNGLRESHRGIRDSLVKPDEGLAAIWLVRLALLIVSVLSLAQSQVRLFLVAPTGRQIHPRWPGRKSLFGFDHAKLNCVRRFAIAEVRGMASNVKWNGDVQFFQKPINIDQRLGNQESMLVLSPSSLASTGD
jgi:hypothetical protein